MLNDQNPIKKLKKYFEQHKLKNHTTMLRYCINICSINETLLILALMLSAMRKVHLKKRFRDRKLIEYIITPFFDFLFSDIVSNELNEIEESSFHFFHDVLVIARHQLFKILLYYVDGEITVPSFREDLVSRVDKIKFCSQLMQL